MFTHISLIFFIFRADTSPSFDAIFDPHFIRLTKSVIIFRNLICVAATRRIREFASHRGVPLRIFVDARFKYDNLCGGRREHSRPVSRTNFGLDSSRVSRVTRMDVERMEQRCV